MSTPAAHRQRRPEAVLHPGAPTETRFTSACNDGCCGEGVGGHRTVQPPGDRGGTFAVVFDVQRLTQAQEPCRPEFIARSVPDEEGSDGVCPNFPDPELDDPDRPTAATPTGLNRIQRRLAWPSS
jgi:hypothetical protein